MTKRDGTDSVKRSQAKTGPSQPSIYQIRIEGHLGDQWTDRFGGLTITLEDNGDTLLTGPVVDQAALFGLLKKVRDLGIPLVSLKRIEPGKPDMSSTSLEKEKRNERENSILG